MASDAFRVCILLMFRPVYTNIYIGQVKLAGSGITQLAMGALILAELLATGACRQSPHTMSHGLGPGTPPTTIPQ